MLSPYLLGLFWAAVLAAVFHPVYLAINRRLKQPSLSSLLTVLLSVLVLTLPVIGVMGVTIQQALQLEAQLNTNQTQVLIRDYAQHVLENPIISSTVDIDINELQTKARSAAATALQKTGSLLQASTHSLLQIIVNVCIMLYAMYYFLKDGGNWLKRVMYLIPLGDDNEATLYHKFLSTCKATLKGTILIAIIQGTLGGILFALAGVPAAAFWGVVMIVCSMIPALGAIIVWVPAMLYLLFTGDTGAGLIILAGGIGIGLVDNVIRPPLVGRDIQMHSITILLSTLGGLGLFGISGVVMGPLIAAFFFSFLEMYELRYRTQLKSSET